MDRRHLGSERPLGLAILTALWLAVSQLQTGASTAAGAEPPAAGRLRSFSGKVTEKGTRKPIAGATVKLRRLRFPDPETGHRRVLQETMHQTDAAGIYHFTVPPEQLAEPNFGIIMDVKHPDYPSIQEYHYNFAYQIRLNEALGDLEGSRYDVELVRGEPITGTVMTPDGKPAAGVLVHCSSHFDPDAKPGFLVLACSDDVRTDDHGRFRFVAVTPGEAELSFYPDDYAVLIHRLKDNTRGDLGSFELREGIVLKGRVIDADGTPLPGVMVNIKGFVAPPPDVEKPLLPGEDSVDDLTRSVITDAHGQFTMGPLPPASYRIGPVESLFDPVLGDRMQRLPAPFAVRKVTLEKGKVPEPLELRALPHVAVEARMLDSNGRPATGLTLLLHGTIDTEGKRKPRRSALELPELPGEDDFWQGWSWPDAQGKIVWHVPRGLDYAGISLMGLGTDGGYALRYRIGKDQALQAASDVPLGSLDHDVKDIEIVRDLSSTVRVKVVGRDGSKPRKVVVTARYRESQPGDPVSQALGDDSSEVHFAELDDGRFLSTQLHPDRKLTIHAKADGYREQSATLELPEGAVKELELVMDKP